MNTKDKIKIADIIGRWYFNWKDKMTDYNAPHKLGYAKEDLKVMIDEEFD